MHFHCEIIMPPTDSDALTAHVRNIMAPFNECPDDDEDSDGRHGFWDYWVIGGRWSGAKSMARIDGERLSAFYEELARRKVTVSGVQFGKQELSPASQIPMVDALWLEWFPDSGFEACPPFKHAGDLLNGDLCTFEKAPLDMKCERIIIAGPKYDDPESFEASYMLSQSIWNGVTHQDTNWNGSIRSAVAAYNERLTSYREDYREKRTIKPDWVVVTIDYHS